MRTNEIIATQQNHRQSFSEIAEQMVIAKRKLIIRKYHFLERNRLIIDYSASTTAKAASKIKSM